MKIRKQPEGTVSLLPPRGVGGLATSACPTEPPGWPSTAHLKKASPLDRTAAAREAASARLPLVPPLRISVFGYQLAGLCFSAQPVLTVPPTLLLILCFLPGIQLAHPELPGS